MIDHIGSILDFYLGYNINNTHLEISTLEPIMASYFRVIIFLVKLCLGVLDRIAYIVLFARPLLILI